MWSRISFHFNLISAVVSLCSRWLVFHWYYCSDPVIDWRLSSILTSENTESIQETPESLIFVGWAHILIQQWENLPVEAYTEPLEALKVQKWICVVSNLYGFIHSVEHQT